MILQEFVAWESAHRFEIRRIQEILSNPLSNEPEELINDLKEIESWNGRVGALLSESNSLLDRAKMALKPSKEDGTQLDREIILNDATSQIRLVRDILENLGDCIKQRLILGESCLSYFKVFNDRKYQGGN